MSKSKFLRMYLQSGYNNLLMIRQSTIYNIAWANHATFFFEGSSAFKSTTYNHISHTATLIRLF